MPESTKMASIFVSDRTVKGTSSRFKCEDVDLLEKTSVFKEQLSKVISKSQNDIELVYCGVLLKDEESLESCGVKSGSTIHMLKKPKPIASGSSGCLSNAEVKQVITTLQSALGNPAYRPTIDSLVNSPEALHEIVSAIPGLDSSPSTLALFQDQELLLILAHPGNIRRVIEAHPCFGQTAKMIAAAVQEAGSRNDIPATSTGTYSLDQMSDDEEYAMGAPSGNGSRGGGGGGITPTQLAAALAAASGSPRPSPAPRTTHGGESQPISGPLITSEFFQAAMQQAQSAAIQNQIQQMREMGITDENVARQALQATNGDLQAAIDLIFGGTM